MICISVSVGWYLDPNIFLTCHETEKNVAPHV